MKKLFVVFVVLLAADVMAETEAYLSYDDFIRAVEAGRIQSVSLDGFSMLTGTMAQGDAEQSFQSYAKTGTANDPLLLALLNTHDVQISIADSEDHMPFFSLFYGLMFMGIPILTIVLLFIIYLKLNMILKLLVQDKSLNA